MGKSHRKKIQYIPLSKANFTFGGEDQSISMRNTNEQTEQTKIPSSPLESQDSEQDVKRLANPQQRTQQLDDEDPCMGCDQPASQCICYDDDHDDYMNYEEEESEVKEQCPHCKKWRSGYCECREPDFEEDCSGGAYIFMGILVPDFGREPY